MVKAIDWIRHEHRDIALVVQCFAQVLREVREGKLAPDIKLFEAIIDYMQNFPDRFHHPKEDDYLFKRLRERDPASAKVLDELQSQHAAGERQITALRWKLEALAKDPESGFPAFDEEATRYIDFQKEHMATEEQKVLPRAQEVLTTEDWDEIGRAFANNDDPIFGHDPQAYYDRLFTRIVNLAPEPYGLASRKEPLPKPPQTARRAAVASHWI